MNPLVVNEEIHHGFFQTVEMSVHKACLDVHPGMSAGARRWKTVIRKNTLFFLIPHLDMH